MKNIILIFCLCLMLTGCNYVDHHANDPKKEINNKMYVTEYEGNASNEFGQYEVELEYYDNILKTVSIDVEPENYNEKELDILEYDLLKKGIDGVNYLDYPTLINHEAGITAAYNDALSKNNN